ncbi:MAG: hypothetical protein JKY34_05275 [Kordiimonadaceae bacterium]|uniref:Uncharacterized protein n=1 Tax=SAR86 cluster bacterium TaxID=2030880 RepID=A0A2A4WVD5_9GAMM|nr:hypothetical protein [Kordiimonadaceae bacterium]PCI73777.1 MAG: hypothetical protein COB20_15885 [SAR86 cluster bacterium]
MEIGLVNLISFLLFKLSSLYIGLALAYMGYKLFMNGIWGHAGDAEGSFGNNKLVIKKAAPGTFFAISGLLVVCFTILQGFEANTLTEGGGYVAEKPSLD